ncbi:hypothetical protein RFI_11877 [Reticulomyxa filosa]|uniref:Uncharacterized protein n=1 Tax=Reticulomyxa filosa TaxID=46433 RepID=X6NG03_RETFI|nr:hypothetical protein RFI_11877 [Reticulomyxa filosa]|eukprot:ETO25260.1 hypothetical protein RFI_11877 [Reticulomyxa filosa]
MRWLASLHQSLLPKPASTLCPQKEEVATSSKARNRKQVKKVPFLDYLLSLGKQATSTDGKNRKKKLEGSEESGAGDLKLSDGDNNNIDPIKSLHPLIWNLFCKLWPCECKTKYVSHFSDEQTIQLNGQLSRKRGLVAACNECVAIILQELHHTQSKNRTKALKFLSALVDVDPKIFHFDSIKQVIKAKLSDKSIAVRESAVDLVGKYMLALPFSDFAANETEYLQMLMKRIKDSGVSVRKRVIQILQELCCLLSNGMFAHSNAIAKQNNK